MEKFYTIKSNVEPNVSQIGGKALNLSILTKNNIEVPKWLALTVDFFDHFMGLKVKTIQDKLNGKSFNPAQIASLAKEIEEMIMKEPFNESLKNEIIAEMKNVFPNLEKIYFAVRSSATDEDSINYSFAGQMESFLYQKLDEEFFTSIKKCFASAFGERGLSYRINQNIPLINVKPAVIIQEMIFGEVSGVAFTGNPLTNNPDHALINSAYGIGEGIVSGELDSDIFVVDELNKIIKKQIVKKEEMITFDSDKGFGTIKKTVDVSEQQKPSISDEKIIELTSIIRKIEKNIYKGVLQDIEWCLKDNKIYILQSRPITTLAHINKQKYRTMYDNSNIIESYSGVTTPLTFSLVCDAFKFAYSDFLERIKTPKESMEKLENPLKNSVGYFRGHLFYNLNAWYEGLQSVPGYNLNRQFMEQMMGVKTSVDMEKEKKVGFLRKLFVELPRLIRTVFLLIINLKFINKRVKKYQKIFDATVMKSLHEDFTKYTNRELMNIFYNIYHSIAKNYGIPILNDFGTMIYYGQLSKFFKKLNLKDGDTLQNNLLAGEGEVESTKPTREIISISNWLRENETLKNLFINKSEKELIQLILKENDGAYDGIREKIHFYIKAYGHRAMNELKIEESTIHEDPTFLFTMLKNYLKRPSIDLEEMERKERKVREEAEKIVFKSISFMKKRKLLKILKKARFHIKKREELRFMRTKFSGVMRTIFNTIGQNMVNDGFIDYYKDICFLTFNEIFELIEGRSVNTDIIKKLIEIRKNDYQENMKKEAHERMYFYGDFYQMKFVEIYSDAEVELEQDDNPNILKGTPCSPGEVTGIAKIVLAPEDANLNGEILVTKRTDPGWVPLFPSISGLVIERGSVLSHSAVVAREMGIPTIVGLRKVTDKIKNGDKIRIDGTNGIVEKLS